MQDPISWLAHQRQTQEPGLIGYRRVLGAAKTDFHQVIFGAKQTKHA